MKKTYLGDGVYAQIDPFRVCVVLTTEDGVKATNTIYLEHETLEAFELWIKEIKNGN